MKNLKRLSVTLSIILGVGLYFLYTELTTSEVVIVHTNDVHGHILPLDDIGGSVVLSNFLSKCTSSSRKTQKKPYLLLDAGDVFQGTPEGDIDNGEVVIKIMNELGYDAMAIGNHELSKGQKQLKKLAQLANFPMLGANIIDKKSNKIADWLKPYCIKEIGGVKVGILGITTSAMVYLTMPEVRKGLEFQKEVDIAKKYIPELKQKADVIVALTHIGLSKNATKDDVFLAQNTDGIDIIIGAHSHTFLEKPIMVKNTMIVQAGCYGKSVGKITLKTKNKKVVSAKYELIQLDKKKFGEDKKLKKIIENLTKDVSKKMESVIGLSAQMLLHSASGELSRNGEIPLGNWQADVFRKTTNSDIAFQNAGGIRADLPKGKITLRHIYELAPFDNTIFTMKLTGLQIKKILERSVSSKFGMLQVSGLKFKYDRNKKKGDRVTEIIVGDSTPIVSGTQINPKKYYKVAVNSFVAKGGDKFNIFKHGKEICDTGIIDRDAQALYVKKYSPIKAQIEGRIVNVTPEK
ncbi:MAG: 5'-nucleotidase C-terminal domain-containing protein [Elusimicrobiota bacterium]